MENTLTDTQSNRSKQWEVDYWSTIDRTDMELFGEPLKYHSSEEIADSLGTDDEYIYPILSKIRKRLARCGGNMSNNGQL